MELYENLDFDKAIINSEEKFYPNNWKLKKIKDLTKVTSGGTPSTKERSFWDKQEIKWLSSGEVKNEKITETAKYISSLGLQKSSAKLLPKKSVLIALAGQGKTRGQVGITEVELSTNQSVGAIIPSNSFNSYFLFFNLLNRYSELRVLSGGENGRGGLNLKKINDLDVFLPPLEEQNNIAYLLSSQEKVIEKTKELIKNIDKRNQFMIDELLSGRLRLKEDNNGQVIFYKNEEWKSVVVNGEDFEIPKYWNVEKIDKNIKFSLGSTPLKKGSNYNGELPWITISDLKSKYINTYTAKILKQKNTKELPKGTLLGSFKMSVGRFGFTSENCATNEAIIAIKENECNHNLKYLYYSLPKLFLKNAKKNAQGLLLLNTKSIKVLDMVIPKINEQILISNTLELIENEKEKYEKILNEEVIKFNILLEELMSGRLRIKN